MFEIRILHAIGETLAANTDTFQHSVAGQLIQHQSRIQNSAAFQLVGDDATDEMRVSLVQHVHQVGQAFLYRNKNMIDYGNSNLLFKRNTLPCISSIRS